MGMEARVIVFGKFELMRQVPSILDYPIHFYEDAQDSAIVFGGTGCAYTSHDSRALAFVCGCIPWDFNTHKVSEIHWDTLAECGPLHLKNDLKAVEKCIALGLEVYYQPNG